MKKFFYYFLFFLFYSGLKAQVTITLTPSEDVAIGFHDGANTAGNNYGSAIQNAAFWIPSVAAPPPGVNGNRALIKFPLTSIPSNATIMTAVLNLYAIPVGNLSGHFGNNNSSVIEKITQNWGEYTATWNNQPPTTSLNSVILAQSANATQNYLNTNVLNMVLDMISNPATSFGFKLKLVNESVSNGLCFASKDHSNPALKPQLVITYSVCTENPLAVSGPTSICSGNSATIFATGPSSNNIIWYPSATSNLPIGAGNTFTTPILNSAVQTIYTYFAAGSCTETPRSFINIVVNPLPNVAITSSQFSMCVGNSAVLTAQGASSYSWSLGQGVFSMAPMITVTPTSSAVFQLNGTDNNNCASSSIFSLTVFPLPIVSVSANKLSICSGQSAVLTALGAASYSWSQSTFVFSSAPVITVSPISSAIYQLTGTDANSCTATASISLFVSKCTGVNELVNNKTRITIFPNPNAGCFTVRGDFRQISCDRFVIEDLQGKPVMEKNISSQGTTFEIIDLQINPGIYFCKFKSGDQVYSTEKLIISR